MAFYGQLTGNLGRDPELKYLENGSVVANFTVAVREPKRQGQDQPARWVKVAVWGKAAEYVGNYVRKGDKVACFGRVKAPELFTRRDGSQGLAEVFTAENVEKWSDGQQQQAQQAPGAAAPAQHPAYAAAGHQPAAAAAPAAPQWQPDPSRAPAQAGGLDDNDIPF